VEFPRLLFCGIKKILHIRSSLIKTLFMETNDSLLSPELQIDSIAHAHLAETAKWGNFLGIVGFVLSGLLAILALFAGALLGGLGSAYGGGGAIVSAGFVTILYLFFAALYFFMSLFLYRFSSKMKVALYSTDQDNLNASFLNLKNLYKMMGILTIIYLGILVLALIFGIGAAAFMRQ
jgi:preprotein translocase subunit SecG